MEWDKLYADGIEDCKYPERIIDVGREVAEAISIHRAIEVAFAPGNGTRYCWLFVPFTATIQYESDSHLESASTGEVGVWIASLNGDNNVYSLSFNSERDVPYYTYLSEKWFNGKVNYDLVVFYALIKEILNELAGKRIQERTRVL